MERVRKQLQNYGRFLALEEQLPLLREQLVEGKHLLIEAGGNVRVAQWELEKAEKGGFFQRLLGNQEDKKEQAYRKLRTAQTEKQQAQQELDLRTKALSDAEQEYAALSGSWEAYLRERERFAAMSEGEMPILADICIRQAGKCLEALEQARPWMREDVRRKGVSYSNRKLEFLAIARECAGRMVGLLELLPDGLVEIPQYLRSPDGFILGVTMEYKQLDRLNLAMEQVRKLRRRLREL